MTLLVFIVGLCLGLSVGFGVYFRLKEQLLPLLKTSSESDDPVPDLSTVALIRRELGFLKQEIDQKNKEIDILDQLLENAPIGFLLIDASNYLINCNDQARRWLTIDRWQPSKRRSLIELVRSYDLDRRIQQTRQMGEAQVWEWTFYPMLSSDYPLSDFSNLSRYFPSLYLKGYGFPLPQGQVAVFIENQQPLQELSQKRDRFFSDLTHELRTPLTSLSLLAETLEKRLQPPEKRWAEQMLSEIERLMQLVQDGLDLARIQENPHQNLHFQTVDVQSILLDAWRSLEPIAQKKSISLRYPALNGIFLEADPSRLMQVFLNLFDNSIKHSPPHSQIQIEIETSANPPELTLHFIDSGSGFSDTDLPHIFDRLYRGDPSRTRQSSNAELSRPGSGLGLSIAQEIVAAHGGRIEAQNHPKTGGAWLKITLPLAASLVKTVLP